MAWCAGRRKYFLLFISGYTTGFYIQGCFLFSVLDFYFLTAKPELAVNSPVKSEDFTYSQQDRVDFSTPADALRNVIDARIVTFTHPPVNDKAPVVL
jgi:hypothetical protein